MSAETGHVRLPSLFDREGPLLLAGSPRKGGNTDTAAALLAESVAAYEGVPSERMPSERAAYAEVEAEAKTFAVRTARLADILVRPCISCGFCDSHPGQCALDGPAKVPFARELVPGFSGLDPDRAMPDMPAFAKARPSVDVALPLLRALAAAPVACLLLPVYFYHVPAQSKALLDRAQSFWNVPPAEKPGGGRPLGLVMMAGRPRGENLFAGSVLSLRYFCNALGMTLAEPLLLRGMDGPDALRSDEKACAAVREYGKALVAAL